MQRGNTGHMLFVIAAGLVSLAVCAAIGVALVQVSNYALGGTLSIGVALDQFAIFALGGTLTAICSPFCLSFRCGIIATGDNVKFRDGLAVSPRFQGRGDSGRGIAPQ